MITAILKKINLQFFPKKYSLKQWLRKTTPQFSQRKHLSLQTIYTRSKQIISPTEIVLKKQKEILCTIADFTSANISTISADSSMKFIGLAKHTRTLLKGVLLYDVAILTSAEWNNLVELAAKQQTAIGIFQVKYPTPCLQIKDLKQINRYLIDHRIIKLIELL